ncbi:MAG: hypothetical protein ACLFOY_10695 [Desulfatibacillaceae bacterium]
MRHSEHGHGTGHEHQAWGHSRILWIACIVLVLAAATNQFSFVSADPDLWGHVKFGQDTLAAGELHTTDPYSYTAQGHGWINHEWLSEVLFAGLYNRFGDTGLLVLKFVVGLLVAGLLCAAARIRQVHPLVAAAVLTMCVISMSLGFMVRPQIFSFLFFAACLYILLLYMERGINLLWLAVVIHVVWVNMHGGFLMGVALFLAAAVWETFSWLVLRWRKEAPVNILLAFAAVCLATLVNPYGYELLAFLYESLGKERAISEWAPLPLAGFTYVDAKILMALAAVVIVANGRQNRGWEVCAILLTAYAAIKHQRHVPFFALVVGPYLAWGVSRTMRQAAYRYPAAKLTRTSAVIVLAAALALSGVLVAGAMDRYNMAKWRIVVDPEEYPVTAVRYLRVNGIEGRIIVPFEWGEYAIWWLYPECRVSIDGRFRTVYPERVIEDHFNAIGNYAAFRRLPEKYPADAMLVRQGPWADRFIEDGPEEWLYVYSDRTAVVFLSRSGANSGLLEKGARAATGVKDDPGWYFP